MFSIKKESTLTKVLLLSFILIFFLLCLWSFLLHGEETLLGSLQKFDNDDVKYLRSAWTLLETGRYTYRYPDRDTVFIMPGLTTVLAGFVALFGKLPLLPFRIFQALLGSFSLYLVFLIGRRLFSAPAALLGVFLSVIYIPNLYVTHLVLTEQIFSTLFALFFLVCLEGLSSKRLAHFAWGGVLLGLMALFRPAVILFPLVIFLMWLILRYPLKELLTPAFLVIAIVVVLLSPWMIRNGLLFHRFIPFTVSSGNPLLQGTFIDYDQSVTKKENIDYDALIRQEGKIDLDLFGKDELVTDEAEAWIARYRIRHIMPKDPLAYLKWYTIGKTAKNFEAPFLWFPLFHLDSSYRLYTVWHHIYLVFGFCGLVLLCFRKKMKGVLWFPLLSICYFNFSYLPFYCFGRYLFPVMFLIILFAGWFLWQAITLLKRSLKPVGKNI